MDEVGQAYGLMAREYIELFANGDAMHADDLDLIARHLSTQGGAVLDVGCGPGHLTAYLRSLSINAIGLDLVPEFIDHARARHPGGRYELASMHLLPVPDGSLAGILTWYSLIHLPPAELHPVLVELRRTMAPGGRLIAGFFDGDEIVKFEHKVTPAYCWPADEFGDRLEQAGFTQIDRQQRPGVAEAGRRPHAAIAAIAV